MALDWPSLPYFPQRCIFFLRSRVETAWVRDYSGGRSAFGWTLQAWPRHAVRNLKKLMDAGMVADAPRSALAADDERRFYTLTTSGRSFDRGRPFAEHGKGSEIASSRNEAEKSMNRADFLRSSYCVIVRMQPRPFRERFGGEMMWMFEEERRWGGLARLFFNGMVSLLRQRSKVERARAPVVAGFGLLDTSLDIAPRLFVEAGITASLILAGFMVLLGKVGNPILGPACVPGAPRSAPPRIQVPSRLSAVLVTGHSHSPVDSGKIENSTASAVRIAHAQDMLSGRALSAQ